MLLSVVLILLAIALLFYGAEFSLDASEVVGEILGLSPLTIGMLLIGFGTSLPEFFVGHIAGIKGESGLALGSLVGSNIANLFLILGLSGFIARLGASGKSLREHLFVHLLLCIALFFVFSQKTLSLLTASPLLVVLMIYLFFIYKDMGRSTKLEKDKIVIEKGELLKLILKLLIGFIFLYCGGELLVKGGSDLGAFAGVDTYIISSIFIAFGTSFPELVTAIMAALKKKNTDIIIGNIIGSNLFNCAFILGSLGIYEFNISSVFTVELYTLLGGALFLLFLSFAKKSFHRLSSLIFLSTYIFVVGHWLKYF
jgi:cation:H+ antiporter